MKEDITITDVATAEMRALETETETTENNSNKIEEVVNEIHDMAYDNIAI